LGKHNKIFHLESIDKDLRGLFHSKEIDERDHHKFGPFFYNLFIYFSRKKKEKRTRKEKKRKRNVPLSLLEEELKTIEMNLFH